MARRAPPRRPGRARAPFGADAGREQKLGKIHRTAFGRCGEIAVQPPQVNVLRAHVVMRRHDEMRQACLRRRLRSRRRQAAASSRVMPSGPSVAEKFELLAARRLGAPVGQIDDVALRMSLDRGVRRVDEAFQALRQPVIAPRLFALAVHALLHHEPAPVIGDDEAVQDRGRSRPARPRCRPWRPGGSRSASAAIEPDTFADRHKLVRRLPRMLAAPAADMQAEFAIERRRVPA